MDGGSGVLRRQTQAFSYNGFDSLGRVEERPSQQSRIYRLECFVPTSFVVNISRLILLLFGANTI